MKDVLSRENQRRPDPVSAAPGSSPAWKRALDILLILFSAVLTVPLAVVIALFIKLVSRGPALFRQERVGLRGRRFLCLKFRTMKVGADSATHRRHLQQLIQSQTPMTKLDVKGDARLIPCGALLRATGLDELPQLINVLRGEMSLVGPRPAVPYECEKYADWHWQRFDALPGLTGWWQVGGKNRTTFDEMIQMDIWYATHQSLWLDLKIILLTIPALLCQVLEVRQAGRSIAAQPEVKIL